MTGGRVTKSQIRRRNARRRAALYASSSLGRRNGGLPPHLLPSAVARKK
jgi:hypothetical protein